MDTIQNCVDFLVTISWYYSPNLNYFIKLHRRPYPDILTAVGICQICKQIGHFPLYLVPLMSRFGGSGTGRLVKLPWLASFCHHWINCKKNADSSRPRKMILVRTAECLWYKTIKSKLMRPDMTKCSQSFTHLKFPLNISLQLQSFSSTAGKYVKFIWTARSSLNKRQS